ncbi:MAG TPA: hypothetical protein VJ489_01945 [Thermoplasmata archaeon]|nr:hypothetical protein [Thermoplasmata archaeon]
MSSDGKPEVMDVVAAEKFVIELLRRAGPMTTMQIEVYARNEKKRCPDQTVLFLTKMRRKGLIKGEASLERKGWVWWVP